MANFQNLILDTTAPASPTISIEAGATFATNQLVNTTIGTADGDTTGYQMKIWGTVDTANDANVQATEGASAWITYATSKQVRLSSGDGAKTLNVKIRDDVWNESAQASDNITLDTTVPVVTMSAIDVAKVSKIAGKTTATFTFTSDVSFTDYKVKIVSSSGSAESTGTTIPTTNGSINVSAVGGSFAAATPITTTIKGADLELASAGDGTKIVKVFVKDTAGIWSV